MLPLKGLAWNFLVREQWPQTFCLSWSQIDSAIADTLEHAQLLSIMSIAATSDARDRRAPARARDVRVCMYTSR